MSLAAEVEFGLGMLRQVPADQSLVISPLSVIFALSMVQAGAKGKTKTQINAVISKGQSDDVDLTHYSDLSKQILNATNGVQTRIANGFFLNKQYQLEKDYIEKLTEKFSARIQNEDFSKAAETAKTINDFVSNVTEGKIKELATADSVREAFSIIVNAIYFTAQWDYKFSPAYTSKMNFYSSEENSRKIEFMTAPEVHRLYAEDEEMQVLSLQYKDTSYSFNIFLPKKKFAFDETRRNLSAEKVRQLLSKLQSTYITLTIPKMKIETDYKLKEALIKMGITDMFTDKADFSAMAKVPGLRVSDAAHKAMIEVDEDGTTAAAATMIGMVNAMLVMEKPKEFVADYPFIFMLTKDMNPLFMGQFV